MLLSACESNPTSSILVKPQIDPPSFQRLGKIFQVDPRTSFNCGRMFGPSTSSLEDNLFA
ncbi:MAG: hypothetical protein CMI18_07525 [Opitutaceae bacterium]|nr:hypothetical protein [Opitutaceae bacterium]